MLPSGARTLTLLCWWRNCSETHPSLDQFIADDFCGALLHGSVATVVYLRRRDSLRLGRQLRWREGLTHSSVIACAAHCEQVYRTMHKSRQRKENR